jgi:predicted RNA methylase
MRTETLAPPKLGNTRVTGKEQFYTPKELALQLVGEVENTIGPLRGRTVLEPAGGSGSFIEAVSEVGASKLLSFDIEPLHPKITKGSFLDQQINETNVITISNPPFGRNNSLSIPFFNHAAGFSDAICFIVPRSWRKWSVTNRLDMNFKLALDIDLDIDYVDSEGELVSTKSRLATCFQVWIRTEKPRIPVRIKNMGVVEKVSPADADVSLTVFGYGCGKLKTKFEPVANTTQLFLKLTHPQALSALETVDYSKFYKNTAYTEALSLQEINYLLNEEIFGDPMMESSYL